MKNTLRIIPLGGLGEIGINMTAYEYGDDIFVVDAGIGFPGPDYPGVQYLIPNYTWLEKNKHRIRGLVVTHGHMDHIGAIPYMLPNIGFPPIYSLPLTIGLIERRLQEQGIFDQTQLHNVNAADTLKLGAFSIEFFRVNHSIPDGVGLSISTPVGRVIHTGDWKLDYTAKIQEPADLDKLAKWSGGGVLALLSDSTNAKIPGYSMSEEHLGNTINTFFDEAPGRILFTCNALILTRIQQVIDVSLTHNRKIAIIGRSMANNLEVALNLGYLRAPAEIFIKPEQLKKYPDKQITVLTTGGQGEHLAQLPKMSRGEHRLLTLKSGDTAIVSANPIPGNERALHDMVAELTRQGVRVMHHQMVDIHTSGHARQLELQLMLNIVRPKFFIPIHGEHHMLVAHGLLARGMGMPKENIFIADNGNIIEFTNSGAALLKETVPAEYMFVTASGAGDIPNAAHEENQQMQNAGMVTIIVSQKKEVSILSRGFVFVKDHEDLFRDLTYEIQKLIGNKQASKNLEQQIEQQTQEYLLQKTDRKPLVTVRVITN